MFTKMNPNVMISLKKALYLLVFGFAYVPYAGYQYGHETGYYDFFAWWGIIVFFVFLPIIDHLVGKDPANPSDAQVEKMSQQKWYALLTLAVVPIQAITLIYGAYIFSTTENFSLIGQIGWILSCGIVSAILAINVGHELIHKNSRLETWAGGLLYASVCYGGFKVEHVRGHHVQVSTPADASSARYGQSLYKFLPHAYWHNFLNAWKLESKRLKGKPLQVRNELIWLYGISFSILIAFSVAFGWKGAVFFLGVSWMSFTVLEIINYVEHYGLHRRKLENGKYERTTAAHSWNSNYLVTNMGLFHLQRHSDHHAFPKRRYQVLRHFDESPQLPTGYAGMLLLALVPPLWFKVMNPRVEAYYQGEEWQLSNDQFIEAGKTHVAI
ncbi:MAG: alkane 1-monooxygenase [Moraxellaceae bacterium]|nr:MAG: alkane 1-monooxygenase [Moraxellaceae bacterium]